MRLTDIVTRLGCSAEGEPEVEITGVAGVEEASHTELTFLSNPKYARKLRNTRAAAVIVAMDFKAPSQMPALALLRSENPYLAFAKALELFAPPLRPPAGVHATAVIAPGVKIGRNPSIGPYVVIEEDAELGDDCVLKSFVVIYRGAKIGHRFFAHSHAVVRERVRIGDDVTLQNGAVIGADGFGFAKQADGSYYKIVQAGIAVLEDGVEVQAHSCVDRPAVGETRLRRGVKVDNMVTVGHRSAVGDNTLLCGQAGLAGSTQTGREVMLAGQVGVAGPLTIGDRVIASAQAGIPSDVEANRIISGSPAIDNLLWLKCSAVYAKLPEIHATFRRVRELLMSKSGEREADKSEE